MSATAITETVEKEEPLPRLVRELGVASQLVVASSNANFSDYLYKQRIVEIAAELEKRL